MNTHWLMSHWRPRSFTQYSTAPCARTRHVDAINTDRVSAGRFAYFRVVSRSEIQHFRRSVRFLYRFRFPAAPQLKAQVRETSRAWAWLPQQIRQQSGLRSSVMASLRTRGRKDRTTSSAKRPTDQPLETTFSLPRRNREVRCRPLEQAMELTRIRPRFSRWPLGQCSGGRTIQSPSVERTRSPTAGTASTLRA